MKIPIDSIMSIGNIRDDEDIQELADSMKRNEQQVDIKVSSDGDYFFVIFGHRRLAAAKLLGWTQIDAVIIDVSVAEKKMVINQYEENEQRRNLSYLERARTFLRLFNLGMKQKEIAESLGVSKSDVSLGLSILRADYKLQEAVEDGRLSPSAVEPLLSQSLEVQAELIDTAIKERTARKVTALVKAYGIQEKMLDKEGETVSMEINPLEMLILDEIEYITEHLLIITGILGTLDHISVVNAPMNALVVKAQILEQFVEDKSAK